MAKSAELTDKVLALADDPASRVRMQVAFTLGEVKDGRAVDALARIAVRDVDEPWIRIAVLSSCAVRADQLAVALLKNESFPSQPAAGTWLEPLATIVGAQARTGRDRAVGGSAAAAHGVFNGASCTVGSGRRLTAQRSVALDREIRVHGRCTACRTPGKGGGRTGGRPGGINQPLGVGAVRLLGYSGTADTVAVLVKLLDTRDGESLQLAALRALARLNQAEIAAPLVAAWRESLPKVQEEIIVTLASRPIWIPELLAACEGGRITAGPGSRAHRERRCVATADESLRARADKLFGGASSPRADVDRGYQPVLTTGRRRDARLGGVPSASAWAATSSAIAAFRSAPTWSLTRNRTPAALIESILDPNREVQPNYVSYLIVDSSGRSTTGLVAGRNGRQHHAGPRQGRDRDDSKAGHRADEKHRQVADARGPGEDHPTGADGRLAGVPEERAIRHRHAARLRQPKDR